MSKVINWILDHRWAMLPDTLSAIIEISRRENITSVDPALFHKSDYTFDPKDASVMRLSRKDALTNGQGSFMKGTSTAIRRGSVALIPVMGPIFPRANLMTQMSGASSLQEFATDFNVALDDEEITSIILEVDSPGGEITDVEAMSEMIFEARKIKPVVAFVTGMGASAAYWIASSASRIVGAKTSEVGSIGVVAGVRDTSEKDSREGIRNIQIVSSISPQKRPDLTSEDGRKGIQAIVDDLGVMFAETVARNRGTSLENVVQNFGRGGMLLAKDALKVGMIDAIGSLESLISQLNNQPQSTSGGSMPKLITEATSADIKAENPGVYNAILAEGKKDALREIDVDAKIAVAREEAAEAENARIKSIEALSIPGAESIIKEGKFDRKQTAASISLKIVQAQQEKVKVSGDNLVADASDLSDKISSLGASQPDASASASSEEKLLVTAMVAGLNSKSTKES